jgi:hypothetical protein
MKLRKSTLQTKAAPAFYEKVGVYIEQWLNSNHKLRLRPGTQKELSSELKKYGVVATPSQLSRYINGINEMPARVVNVIIDQLGFKAQTFSDYYIKQRENINLELLTKEDLYKLIAEQTLIIKEWKDIANNYSGRVHKLLDDNVALVKAMHKSISENEEMRKEIRSLKRD